MGGHLLGLWHGHGLQWLGDGLGFRGDRFGKLMLGVGKPYELVGIGGQVQRRRTDGADDERQVQQRVVFQDPHVDAEAADGAKMRLMPGQRT